MNKVERSGRLAIRSKKESFAKRSCQGLYVLYSPTEARRCPESRVWSACRNCRACVRNIYLLGCMDLWAFLSRYIYHSSTRCEPRTIPHLNQRKQVASCPPRVVWEGGRAVRGLPGFLYPYIYIYVCVYSPYPAFSPTLLHPEQEWASHGLNCKHPSTTPPSPQPTPPTPRPKKGMADDRQTVQKFAV